jgi:hypothetical protein
MYSTKRPSKDTATRYGVYRRTLHRWLLRYANEGLGALGDKSSKPDRCPHQMARRSKQVPNVRVGWFVAGIDGVKDVSPRGAQQFQPVP